MLKKTHTYQDPDMDDAGIPRKKHPMDTRSSKPQDEASATGQLTEDEERGSSSEEEEEMGSTPRSVVDPRIMPENPIPSTPQSDLTTLMQFLVMKDAQERERQESIRKQERKERRKRDAEDKKDRLAREEAQRKRDEKALEAQQRREDKIRKDRERAEARIAEAQRALEERLADQETSRRKESERIRSEEHLRADERQSKIDLRTHSQAFASFKKLTNPKGLEALLQSFEEVAQLNDVPKDKWAILLTPLLNDASASFRNAMPKFSRCSYDAVKTALLNLHEFHRDHYRSLWTGRHLEETSDLSFQTITNELSGTFLSWKKLEDNVQDWMIREQFLKIIHPEVSSYVIMQDPKTAKEAAEIASRFRSQNPHLPHLKSQWGASNPKWTKRRMDDRPSQGSGGRPKEGSFRKNREDFKGIKQEGPAKDIPTPSSTKTEPLRCWTCGAEGHVRKHCPNQRECNVMSTSKDKPPKRVFQGKIFGHAIQDIIIDSGATQSMVAPKWMPANTPVQGKIFTKGLFAEPQKSSNKTVRQKHSAHGDVAPRNDTRRNPRNRHGRRNGPVGRRP